jgi:Zn ribbon nucleic-acid-binding protein
MRALSGCSRCGHVERSYGHRTEVPVRDCPECGHPMREMGLLGARLLIHERELTKQARAQMRDRLLEQARRSRRLLERGLRSPTSESMPNRRI